MNENLGGNIKVSAMEMFPLFIPFKRAHKISLGLSEGREILLLKVVTNNGITGFGEAVAHPTFTGETLESLLSSVSYLKDSIVGKNPLNINEVNGLMDKKLYANYGAKAAIETALFDIMGKYFRVPVFDLLGGRMKEKLPLSRSISQSDLKKDIDDAREFIREGYRILKIKVGVLNINQDIQRVRAVREAVGPDVSLRVDANQGWNVPEALRFIEQVRDCGLEFVEQPVPKWDLEGLAYLRSKSSIPILADESATTEHDVLELIRRKAADFISFKVLKCGGIMRARRIQALADSAGIQCYLGSQIETGVGTSASLHFALSTESFNYGGEIYGPIFFKASIEKKRIRIENGFIYPSDEPGLGVEPDMDKVKDLTIKVS
jgi:muconate/chloromuconate cycloisomerase